MTTQRTMKADTISNNQGNTNTKPGKIVDAGGAPIGGEGSGGGEVATTSGRERALSPINAFGHELAGKGNQIRAMLPQSIPYEQFVRTVMHVVGRNPELLELDRRSLILACIDAASDGLVPDGRQGAIIPFKGKAQWMPMVAGLVKQVLNTGEVTSVQAQVVYENDLFEFSFGDDPKITHTLPQSGDRNRGEPIGAYAIATMANGERVREFMDVGEIEKTRSVSRAANDSPWVKWWPEMARKTVIRRLTKYLPMSAEDLDRIDRILDRGQPQLQAAQSNKAIEALNNGLGGE